MPHQVNQLKRILGSSMVELVCGFVLLVPVILGIFDLATIYVGYTLNKNACRSAVLAASTGPPDIISKGSPQHRAENALRKAEQSPTFCLDPCPQVKEVIDPPVPAPPLGGPVKGTVNVTTSINVHPPFLIGSFVSMSGIKLSATESASYNFIVPSAQGHMEIMPTDDIWDVTIDTMTLEHYLEYPGSTLDPVVKASVAYAKESKNGDVRKLYEDVYYSKTCAIGCNQYCQLELLGGSQGLIRIINSSQKPITDTQAYAATNAALRMLLDLAVKGCFVKQISIPLDSFDTIIAGFYNNGFKAPSDNNQNLVLSLSVVSEPQGQTTVVNY